MGRPSWGWKVTSPDDVNRRLRSLEGWRNDVSRELREWEEWYAFVKPFLEQLQADFVYRQKRHAETAADWSMFAKVLAAVVGIVVAVTAVGSFILQIVHASGH